MFWIGLIVGLLIGSNLSILIYSIISISKTTKENDEKEADNEKI